MRDTKPRHRRRRAVTLLLLPFLAVIWLVGWSLYWVGGRKDGERLKSDVKRQENHVTLIPANVIEEENEDMEMPRRRAN